MVDWKQIKCTHCRSKKRCRRENISKGSNICQIRMKIRTQKESKGMTKQRASTAMLYGLYDKMKGKKKEEE